jgi:putative toxin-antitoxin system antitoxin component (TIGR02293 family)
MQTYEAELRGVDSLLLKDLAKRMDIPAVRIFQIVGIPKATAERKTAAQEPITGAAGQAALGLTRLLGLAKGIVADSTAEAAKDFDAARWLGRWIERPQPALGGRKPADLIATPTGLEMVARLLGAIESGAYQ